MARSRTTPISTIRSATAGRRAAREISSPDAAMRPMVLTAAPDPASTARRIRPRSGASSPQTRRRVTRADAPLESPGRGEAAPRAPGRGEAPPRAPGGRPEVPLIGPGTTEGPAPTEVLPAPGAWWHPARPGPL